MNSMIRLQKHVVDHKASRSPNCVRVNWIYKFNFRTSHFCVFHHFTEEERTGAYLASFHKPDQDVESLVQYPNNLTFKDLLYFLCVPTLCYELNFPRTNRIRKRFLLKRILEVVIGINVIFALFQQWMIPAVRNALIPFSNMDVANATERLLKLAVKSWLSFAILSVFWFYSSPTPPPLYFCRSQIIWCG